MKAQAKREEVARLNYGSVKAERLPSISAFGNYGTTGQEIIGATPTRAYGISMKVPVFDGGRRDARRAASLSELRQQQGRTRNVKQKGGPDERIALDSIPGGESGGRPLKKGSGLHKMNSPRLEEDMKAASRID